MASWAAYFGPKCKNKVKLTYTAEPTTLLPKFRWNGEDLVKSSLHLFWTKFKTKDFNRTFQSYEIKKILIATQQILGMIMVLILMCITQ